MGFARIEVSVVVRAPLQQVFERITDHEAMAQWPGISSCALIAEGTPRNGVGAIRRIKASGLTLDEQVVSFEPPHGYAYQIIRGLPVKHLGTVRLTEAADGVRVDWHVELSSRLPLVAQLVGMALRRGLPGALKYFAQTLAPAQ